MKDFLGSKQPIMPFGSLVEYYPISAKDQSKIHQFGKKVSPGLFRGYVLYAGETARVAFFGEDRRTSTLPNSGKGQRNFLGESERSPPPPPHDSLQDAGEAINDFWSMSRNFKYTNHVEPRVKLHSERRTFTTEMQ